MKNPLIALLTDFGDDDFFAASLKAVILKINPQARIVDITHKISSFDIRTANFVLFAVYRYFPEDTIFLTVVDPGVGSERKILLSRSRKYFFIGPDNGILSGALEQEEIQEIRAVSNVKYFLPRRSKTFEGRDKMAPVAGWLSKGIEPRQFGPRLSTYKKLDISRPEVKGNEISGRVVYADKFGNLITNIPAAAFSFAERRGESWTLKIRQKKTSSFRETYAAARKGEIFFLVGSLGTIEIAVKEDSAQRRLKAEPGDGVKIIC